MFRRKQRSTYRSPIDRGGDEKGDVLVCFNGASLNENNVDVVCRAFFSGSFARYLAFGPVSVGPCDRPLRKNEISGEKRAVLSAELLYSGK